MNLDDLYDNFVQTRKEKTLSGSLNLKTLEEKKPLEDFYNTKNFSIFNEINIYSKFHFEWYY